MWVLSTSECFLVLFGSGLLLWMLIHKLIAGLLQCVPSCTWFRIYSARTLTNPSLACFSASPYIARLCSHASINPYTACRWLTSECPVDSDPLSSTHNHQPVAGLLCPFVCLDVNVCARHVLLGLRLAYFSVPSNASCDILLRMHTHKPLAGLVSSLFVRALWVGLLLCLCNQ